MYTDQTIQAVKSAAEIVDVIGSFVHLTKEGTNQIACCPFHAERSPSFKVSPVKQIYKCFGCGVQGDSIQFLMEKEKYTYTQAIEWLAHRYHVSLDTISSAPKVYSLPVWKNRTTLSDKIVKWFEGRRISQRTLEAMNVTEGLEWMPGPNKEVNTIHFNYFRNSILTQVKYRGAQKTFKLHKGAELILYNIDSIKDQDECYWVEGEPDALAMIEAGITNVVSVPNGATKDTNNLQYIDNCIEELKHIKKHHLGFDNDLNGRKLREDVSERLGKDKCDYIEFKDCKDANDCLIRYGIQGLIECAVNKIEFPLEGIFPVSAFSNEIDDMYLNGLDRGIDLEIPNFDLRIVKKYITTITGIPGHGKSEWVDEMALRAVIKHNWKGAFYSPENKPTQLHFSKIARKIVGKHWDGKGRMSESEKNLVKDFLEKKIWFIKPEKDFSLTTILQQIRNLQVRHGLDFFVIDAWNKLEHKGDANTDYIGRALDDLALFCETYNLHCFLVVHPRKVEKNQSTGHYNVPTMYDCAGSAHFNNKTDNGLCAYKLFGQDVTRIYKQKIKFDHWGTIGYSEYQFNVVSKRYYIEGCYDDCNWITREPNSYVTHSQIVTLETDLDLDF